MTPPMTQPDQQATQQRLKDLEDKLTGIRRRQHISGESPAALSNCIEAQIKELKLQLDSGRIQENEELALARTQEAALNRQRAELRYIYEGRHYSRGPKKRECLNQIEARGLSIIREATTLQEALKGIQKAQQEKSDMTADEFQTRYNKVVGRPTADKHESEIREVVQLLLRTSLIVMACQNMVDDVRLEASITTSCSASGGAAAASDGGSRGQDSGASLHGIPDKDHVSISFKLTSSSTSSPSSVNAPSASEEIDSPHNFLLVLLISCYNRLREIQTDSSEVLELAVWIARITNNDDEDTQALEFPMGGACEGNRNSLAVIENHTEIPVNSIDGNVSSTLPWPELRPACPDISDTPLEGVNTKLNGWSLELNSGQAFHTPNPFHNNILIGEC